MMGNEESDALVVRLAKLPARLLPQKDLQTKLDCWADGAGPVAPAELRSWQDHCIGLLMQLPVLLTGAVESDGVIQSLRCAHSEDLVEHKTHRHADVPHGAGQELTAAKAQAEAVRDQCPLGASLLATLYELSAAGSVSDLGEPCSSDRVKSAAEEATTAIASAAGWPLLQLQKAAHGEVCRLLNAEIRLAEARHSTHRTRRLAAALAHAALNLRRPHLASAAEAQKLLPLLLRWGEIVDLPARVSMLQALRHCLDNLPVVDVRAHAALLAHTLRKLLVFREAPSLAEVLPALATAWPHVTNEHVVAGAAAREAMHIGLAEKLAMELLYVAPHKASRRLYLRHLPALLLPVGLLLCTHLHPMLKALTHLLDAEVDASVEAAASAEPEVRARAFCGVHDALEALGAALGCVGPRAGAHATLIVKHAVGAHLRTASAIASRGVPQLAPSDADAAALSTGPVLAEVNALLCLLCTAGGRPVCEAALRCVRARPSLV